MSGPAEEQVLCPVLKILGSPLLVLIKFSPGGAFQSKNEARVPSPVLKDTGLAIAHRSATRRDGQTTVHS